jgi:hypothetical protein
MVQPIILPYLNIDGNGATSAYLTSSSLTGNQSTLAVPTIQTSNLNVGTISNNSITLSWTNGNGGSRIIIARQGSPVNALPVNYTSYTASSLGSGTEIGTGNWVVYKGSGTTATILGLTFNTNYYFTILEFNGNTAPVYLTSSPPVINASTASAPTIPASNLFFNGTEGNSITFSWSPGNGTSRMIIAKAGSAVTALPVNGTNYTANSVFGSGTAIGPVNL